MGEHPEQRRAERLNVPRHCRDARLSGKATMHLLDLSSTGALIEHEEPIQTWSDLTLDLPPALGGGRITAAVVWSRISGQKPVRERASRLVFQSGLAFLPRTHEEQAILTTALIRLAGEWALALLRDLRQQAKQKPANQAAFEALCDSTLGWLSREIHALRSAKAD